jgi:hypothetical protein
MSISKTVRRMSVRRRITMRIKVEIARRLGAKPEKIVADLYAASPSSWKTACMALRMLA